MKRFVYILGIMFLLLSCDDKNFYEIEGNLSNLQDVTLFVVFESPDMLKIDTVITNEKGNFFVYHESEDEDIQTITFYYHDRNEWFMVYPELGQKIQIKGDARYPQLLQIRGGRINDKLSQFKKKATPLLKQISEMQNFGFESSSMSDRKVMLIPSLNLEIQKSVQDFITKNPEERASAVLISEYFTDPEEFELTESMLQILSPELNDFFIVRNIRKEIEKAKTTQKGAKAPDFRVTNIHGKTYTVDSLANKHFILAFTALWCDLCKTEVLMLDKIAEKYEKDALEILLISLDDDLEDIKEMLQQDSIQWNLVVDTAGQSIRLFDVYNVNSLPKCFLIDDNGIILLNTKNGDELRQTVEEILK